MHVLLRFWRMTAIWLEWHERGVLGRAHVHDEFFFVRRGYSGQPSPQRSPPHFHLLARGGCGDVRPALLVRAGRSLVSPLPSVEFNAFWAGIRWRRLSYAKRVLAAISPPLVTRRARERKEGARGEWEVPC